MTNERVSQQEPVWPKPSVQQVLQVFEQSGQNLCKPAKRRADRPATISWSHLCFAYTLLFAWLERAIGSMTADWQRTFRWLCPSEREQSRDLQSHRVSSKAAPMAL